jgi:hypothetical protein
MSDPHEVDLDAETITRAAAQRGLGGRPWLRSASAVLWAGFLGATCTTVATLLTPDSWLTPPIGFDRLAAIFAISWVLALIPAIAVALLSMPHGARQDEHSHEA